MLYRLSISSIFSSQLVLGTLLFSIIQLASYGRNITAVSGSCNDIQTAVNSATAGDVVVIPAGEYNFSGTMIFKAGIKIKGAGKDSTKLIKVDLNSKPMFKVDIQTTRPFQISDIAFCGVGAQALLEDENSTILDSGIEIYGKATGFIIKDCRFQGFSAHGIKLHPNHWTALLGHPTGVIYHNEFINIFYCQASGNCRGYGVAVYGDESWPIYLQLGTANAVFIEDNYFERNRHCVSSQFGSRYVFRHNTIKDNYYPYAAIDAHGKYAGERGSRSYEIYNNTITGGVEWGTNIPHGTWGIGLRGGDGVVFNNSISNTSHDIMIMIEKFYDLDDSDSYPLDYQIRDLWLWNNQHNGESLDSLHIGWSDAIAEELMPFLQENRDFFFNGVKPGYSPYIYPHPLRAQLAHWKFDNSSDDIAIDNSASGNNGQIYYATITDGKYGNALDFNGINAYVDCGVNNQLQVTGALTVSAWINARSGANNYDSTAFHRVIASCYKWHADNGGEGWYLSSTWKSNNLIFEVRNETQNIGVTYDNFFTAGKGLNQWKYVVGVFKPHEYMKLYIDGQCVAELTSDIPDSISYRPNTLTTIGRRSDGNYFFDGKIDNVEIYAKALSAKEIKQLDNNVLDSSFEAGLGQNENWYISTGSPVVDTDEKYDGECSIRFNKPQSDPSTDSRIKQSHYIPVNPNEDYTLSAWIKGSGLTVGTAGWHRFSAVGRWYDKNMVRINNSYPDMDFPDGSYDWREFTVIRHSPENAAYFKFIAIGILQTGTGIGWIDKISFYPTIP